MGFLDGVRIVDATRLLPGGYCTMLLSDMGAEVIKVEQPGLGDYIRATPPTKDGVSPVHSTANRNKLSIGIDLKRAEGKEVLRRLVKTADVFVEGFRPGAMERLGFSFQSVERMNPRIVYCSISSYGQGNRLSSMPGHDINFEAMSGALGYAKEPEMPMLQLGDLSSGLYAALTIAGALVNRRRAVFIDVPIVQSLVSWMILPASAYLATGERPSEGHSLVFGSDPYYRLYRTSDGGYIAVAAIEERFWHNLVTALGVPELERKRFGSADERREVLSAMERVFASKTRDEWARLLMGKDTCATPVMGLDEALESAWASGMLADVKGDGRVLNSPVTTTPEMRSKPFLHAPALGEQTATILKSLGYSARQAAALKRSGAVE